MVLGLQNINQMKCLSWNSNGKGTLSPTREVKFLLVFIREISGEAPPAKDLKLKNVI